MIVQEYQPAWAAEFAQLRDVLAARLGPLATPIHHVGSTSIPGMLAKPVLDVDVEASEGVTVQQMTASLAGLGYIYEGDKGIADRHAYAQTCDRVPLVQPPRRWMRQHLYVCPAGSQELRRHLH